MPSQYAMGHQGNQHPMERPPYVMAPQHNMAAQHMSAQHMAAQHMVAQHMAAQCPAAHQPPPGSTSLGSPPQPWGAMGTPSNHPYAHYGVAHDDDMEPFSPLYVSSAFDPRRAQHL